MCGRTCVGVTGGKTARAHALRTHVLEVISHAHARVRPHIARVRVRTHLRNSYLGSYESLKGLEHYRGSGYFFGCLKTCTSSGVD